MKKALLLLTLFFNCFSSENNTSSSSSTHFLEKIRYITKDQFKNNIALLLAQDQDENSRKIAECLMFLYTEISETQFALQGRNSQIDYLNKQIDQIKQTIIKSQN